MNGNLRTATYLVVLFLACPASAQQANIADLVKTDIGLEAGACAAFFGFMAEGMRRSLPPGPQHDKEVAD